MIIPEEQKLLLNPNHPDFSKIEVVQTKPFNFGPSPQRTAIQTFIKTAMESIFPL